MAQAPVFYSVGGLAVKKGESYSLANLPTTSAVIDTLRIVEAPRIWRADINRDGSQNTRDGEPLYIKGNQRGVRIIIQRAGATFQVDHPNTPVLYKEGDEIALHADNTYIFLNDCIVEFGTAK